MSSPPSSPSLRMTLSPRQLPELLSTLYQRAPASVLTISSLLISYLVNAAYLDYRLYCAIGTGGLGKPSFVKWLMHAVILKPMTMSDAAAKDPTYLPLNDMDWDLLVTKSGGKHRLDELPLRKGKRPVVFGTIPHRQLEKREKEGSQRQEEIISHLEQLGHRYPDIMTMALSTYEADKAPALFVTHSASEKTPSPTRIAKLYLSGNPPPKRTLKGAALDKVDTNKHEVAHVHLSEGSLHVNLSPQDARLVVKQGWGELHPLAGLFYRGFYFPPYWLPTRLFNLLGGQSKARWAYQQRQSNTKAKLVPPTYCMVYAPNTPEQVEWTKAILDASISWAVGKPL